MTKYGISITPKTVRSPARPQTQQQKSKTGIKTNPVQPVYIVVAECQREDVIMGAYHTLNQAIRRYRQVARTPTYRHRQNEQSNVTPCLAIRLFEVTGSKLTSVTHIDLYDRPPDEHKLSDSLQNLTPKKRNTNT